MYVFYMIVKLTFTNSRRSPIISFKKVISHIMKSLLIVITLILAYPSYAIDFEKYKYVIITENECENIDAAIEKFEMLREYENLKAPNKQHNKCGIRYDGKLGCISITESSEALEENISFFENDPKWNSIATAMWNDCGVEYFGFERESISFE